MTSAGLGSFAEGPLPGYTGGFNEPTCQQCHFGNELNDPAGSLELEIPEGFKPGETYDVTVRLKRPGLERGGFQVSARIAEGAGAGSDAGRLEAAGTAIQLVKSADGKVTYVQHTPAGTRTGEPGSLTWMFRWVAPAGGVAVRFDAAANASNDDESAMDDFIYTATELVPQSSLSGAVADSAPDAFFIK